MTKRRARAIITFVAGAAYGSLWWVGAVFHEASWGILWIPACVVSGTAAIVGIIYLCVWAWSDKEK